MNKLQWIPAFTSVLAVLISGAAFNSATNAYSELQRIQVPVKQQFDRKARIEADEIELMVDLKRYVEEALKKCVPEPLMPDAKEEDKKAIAAKNAQLEQRRKELERLVKNIEVHQIEIHHGVWPPMAQEWKQLLGALEGGYLNDNTLSDEQRGQKLMRIQTHFEDLRER